jgi:sugar lactone lactonase YvrE
MSVGEINEEGRVRPFPDKGWNQWSPGRSAKDHFVCVQSVVIDDQNRLWVLDPANPQFQGVVPGGAKLMSFNIQTGNVLKRIVFDSSVVRANSYLNDVRIDTDAGYAYITDSNDGSIVTVNLKTGKSRRLLDNHYSTEPELPLVINGSVWKTAAGDPNFIASDGIALDHKQEYLYYHALSGLSLYRIHTRYLKDFTLSGGKIADQVEFVARTTASDGMIAGENDAIYHSDVENNAITRYGQDGSLSTVISDERIKWPDTFSFGPDGDLYFTTSQIHIPNPDQPYRIFKIDL